MPLKHPFKLVSCLTGLLLSINTMAEDRALIIGINAYTPDAKGSGPLEGCRTDAQNMHQLIQEVWGYRSSQIKTLLDKEATRRAILTAFDNWLVKGSQTGDRVLFYYSGHGSSVRDDNGDEDDGRDEVLCPVDSIPNIENVIRDDEINARLRKLSGRQVIVITDSCHSGTVTRNFGLPGRTKQYIYPDEPEPMVTRSFIPEPSSTLVETLDNVIHYSAVSASQLALDGGRSGGIFTNAFIKAVKERRADSNRDGTVTHAEVLNYVKKASGDFCDDCEQRLTPQLDGNPKWRFIDITSRAIGPPPPTNSTTQTTVIAETITSGNNNSARVEAEMLPSTTFRLGEQMQIRVGSQRQGFLLLLDIDSAGKLTVIFPNEYSRKNNKRGILQAGQSITIPDASYGFSFDAQEPPGKGLLLALLIEEDESFMKDFYQRLQSSTRGFGVSGGFDTIQRPNQVQEALQQLHKQLNQTLATSEGVGRPIRWSMTEINYEIRR
jgi:hypothetical protein